MTKEQSQKIQQDDDVIDLLELLMVFKRKLWAILLAAVIFGGAAGAVSKFLLIPQYSSSVLLYVLSKETTLTSLADLQIGSQLSKDYKVIILTRPLLQEVINRLNLDIDYKQLREKITISDCSERILMLTVKDEDPRMAMEIVNQVAARASDYIGDIVEMVPPKIIEDGEINEIPISPDHKKYALLGAFGGIALVCGVLTVKFLLNDTVQTEEDVEKYLELTVLASVPERKRTKEEKRMEDKDDFDDNRKKKSRRKAAKKDGEREERR